LRPRLRRALGQLYVPLRALDERTARCCVGHPRRGSARKQSPAACPPARVDTWDPRAVEGGRAHDRPGCRQPSRMPPRGRGGSRSPIASSRV